MTAVLLDQLARLLIEAAPKIDLSPAIIKEWRAVEPLFRQLREPERAAIPMQALDLRPDGGLHNILSVYDQATPEEREFWGHWYKRASQVVHSMAARHGLPVAVVAGVVAVLSPGNRWWINVRVADKLITFWRQDALALMGPLSAYPDNVRKALTVLERGSPAGLVDSPKVGVFFKSLMDPAGVANNMVLDGHAINIWRGTKRSLKGIDAPTDGQREQMLDDYREAARILGTTVQAVQATTWFVWRFVAGGPAVPERQRLAAELLDAVGLALALKDARQSADIDVPDAAELLDRVERALATLDLLTGLPDDHLLTGEQAAALREHAEAIRTIVRAIQRAMQNDSEVPS